MKHQFENKEIAYSPDEMEDIDSTRRELERCLSLKGCCSPMESDHFYKQFITIDYVQFARSNVDISMQQNPRNKKYFLAEELSINHDTAEPLSFETGSENIHFSVPRMGVVLHFAASKLFQKLYLRLVRN